MYCIYNVLTSRKSNSICLFLRLIYKHTCTHIWIYIFTLISERKKKKKVIFNNTTLLPVLVWKAVDLSPLSLQVWGQSWFSSHN